MRKVCQTSCGVIGDSALFHRAMRAGSLVGLLACCAVLQGCLAAAWVAAVGVDSLRASDITFWPFEQSWVSQPDASSGVSDRRSLTSVALLPVDGDEEMTSRLAQALQQQTTLRLESTANPEREVVSPMTDEARAATAQNVSHELAVDAVLFGRVSEVAAHPSDWGMKREESRRLILHLVNQDGKLLWKDELPFTVVKGSKPPLEQSVQASLTRHLMDHVHALGLDNLGYLPPKAS